MEREGVIRERDGERGRKSDRDRDGATRTRRVR